MRVLFLTAIVFLTGCAGLGTAMQTVGTSMQENARNNRDINCTTTSYSPGLYHSTCR